jgi:hypothetical protein
MAEKLTMKQLAEEVAALRGQIAKLATAKPAPAEKSKARPTGARKELTADQRHALVEALAHFKAARRAQTGRTGDAENDWLEAEAEVTLLLTALGQDS